MVQFKFYATLLDAFQNYLSSSEIYQQYWGFSEDPKLTEAEFEQEQFQSLIDRINRVPFESEPAAKGTAFNEMIDCIIEHRKSKDYVITPDKSINKIFVKNDKYDFDFPYDISIQIANGLDGALTQQRVEGTISTKYGNVLLYGYIDELLPFKVVDIKTTSKYNAFKYRSNWQHKVYPFCLHQNQIFIDEFEYVITDFKKIYTELYLFNKEKDSLDIQNHCEQFIEFLQANKELITDTKILALDEQEVIM